MKIEDFVLGVTVFLVIVGSLVALDNLKDIDPPSGPFDGFQ